MKTELKIGDKLKVQHSFLATIEAHSTQKWVYKGDIIEIRRRGIFRNEYKQYFHAPEDVILNNCLKLDQL
jgi:hypothetical protein